MQLEYSPEFKKQWAKMPKKIRARALERLALLSEDQFSPLLYNHKLVGRYASHRSINVTGDWRIIYRQINDDTLRLRVIGTHSQLYF
jgi:addiction module RelE/StbE family toxin